MKYKDSDITLLRQWQDPRLNLRLRAIIMLMDYIYSYRGQDLVITSIWREDPDSLHYHWRAIDVRTVGIPEPVLDYTKETINMYFPYDPRRAWLETCYRHVGTADHFHVQVMSTPIS